MQINRNFMTPHWGWYDKDSGKRGGNFKRIVPTLNPPLRVVGKKEDRKYTFTDGEVFGAVKQIVVHVGVGLPQPRGRHEPPFDEPVVFTGQLNYDYMIVAEAEFHNEIPVHVHVVHGHQFQFVSQFFAGVKHVRDEIQCFGRFGHQRQTVLARVVRIADTCVRRYHLRPINRLG